MPKRLPPSFRQIGEILAPILAGVAARDKFKQDSRKVRIMAGLLAVSGLELSDETRLLQMLVVDRVWPGPREEVEEFFDEALAYARRAKEERPGL